MLQACLTIIYLRNTLDALTFCVREGSVSASCYVLFAEENINILQAQETWLTILTGNRESIWVLITGKAVRT